MRLSELTESLVHSRTPLGGVFADARQERDEQESDDREEEPDDPPDPAVATFRGSCLEADDAEQKSDQEAEEFHA